MSLPRDDPKVVRRAQIVDIARSIPVGIVLPLETSVLITIAIKHFDAAGWVKGVIATGAGVGLLVSPVVTAIARKSRRASMVPAAVVCFVGAAGFALGSLSTLPLFVIGSVIGVAATSAVLPLMTHTYDRNFPSSQRGTRVGWGMAVKVAASAISGLAMGSFLKRHLELWWVILVLASGALLVVTILQLQIPSDPLDPVDGQRTRPWPHFHLLATDRRLRLTLSTWMLMGFGNLMLLPLRVEYLARPRYGIEANAAKITMLTVTIPALVRLITMPLFGLVFDRVSFFTARITVNLLFALYIAAFFTGTTNAGLVLGAAVLGIGSAGGDIMWSLWVTKFASPGRVADYMGLHTFFTGVRGVCAPLLGFAILGQISLITVAWIAAGLIVASAVFLVPEARAERLGAIDSVQPIDPGGGGVEHGVTLGG